MSYNGMPLDLVDAMPRDRASAVILVTGGAGYIGSCLVRQLLERGNRVRVLENFLYGNAPLRDIMGHPELEVVEGDFRARDDAFQAVEGAETVIHLGGIVGDPACSIDQDLTIEINLTATRTLAEVASQCAVRRFVFASTCSVYGASDGELDEESALNPISLYANTKIASEELLLGGTAWNFEPVVLRFATVYGLSPRPRFDLVVNLLTAKAVRDGKITIHGGDQWRPFVHVEDLARALVLTVDAPSEVVSGQIFNVGASKGNYRLSNIGEIIQQLVPFSEVAINDQMTDRRNYYVKFDKFHSRLGFMPNHTVHSGVSDLRDHLMLGLIGDYRDPVYNNVRYLSECPSALLKTMSKQV